MTERSTTLAAMAMAIMMIVTTTGPAPRFVWNVSGSMPTGLYRVRPEPHPAVTTLVVAYPPEPLATWLADGRYLPRGVPLLKPILALGGQTVCRAGSVIAVDGHDVGAAQERDHSGRPLPVWQGCRVISDDEVFLMNPNKPASLDSRYFGPIPISTIIGRAEPLWTSAENRSCRLDANSDAAPRFADLPYRPVSRLPVHAGFGRDAELPRSGARRVLGGDAAPTPHLLPSAITEVNTMDLTTLVTACALTVDPQVMHALIWHQSGGEPWAFSVSGRREPQVLRSVSDAFEAARDTQPDDVAIRVGLAGLPATPRSVTAAMFAPCSNIASVARQIAQLAEVCRTSSRSKSNPIHCAVAAWHGSWERPDTSFADAVRTSVAKNDAPDFEMPSGAGIETLDVDASRRGASRDAEVARSTTPDDGERARLSPLFPISTGLSDRLSTDHP